MLPISNCPLVYEVCPVPPFATGSVPVTPAVKSNCEKERVPEPSVVTGYLLVPPVVGNVRVHVPAAAAVVTVTVPEVVPLSFKVPVWVPDKPKVKIPEESMEERIPALLFCHS